MSKNPAQHKLPDNIPKQFHLTGLVYNVFVSQWSWSSFTQVMAYGLIVIATAWADKDLWWEGHKQHQTEVCINAIEWIYVYTYGNSLWALTYSFNKTQ